MYFTVKIVCGGMILTYGMYRRELACKSWIPTTIFSPSLSPTLLSSIVQVHHRVQGKRWRAPLLDVPVVLEAVAAAEIR